jgi:ABC-type branched-subunit amino acid transport system substrate-binding protein
MLTKEATMSRSSRKNILIKGLFFTAMLLLCGVGFQEALPDEALAQPVKLGLIDMYTGPSAFIANTIKAGFEIAVEEANASGGTAGRTIAVETADMGISTEKATTEVRRMVLQDKIPFVTVGIHSGAAVAAASLAKEMKFLLGAGFATTKG